MPKSKSLEEMAVLKDACWNVLGGVAACSVDSCSHKSWYQESLDRIAVLSGRTVDDEFCAEVSEILREFPCPLD